MKQFKNHEPNGLQNSVKLHLQQVNSDNGSIGSCSLKTLQQGFKFSCDIDLHRSSLSLKKKKKRTHTGSLMTELTSISLGKNTFAG